MLIQHWFHYFFESITFIHCDWVADGIVILAENGYEIFVVDKYGLESGDIFVNFTYYLTAPLQELHVADNSQVWSISARTVATY